MATSGMAQALVLVLLGGLCAGCGLLAKGSDSATPKQSKAERKASSVSVEMPWDTTAVRDNQAAPVLKLALLGDADAPTAVPYLYGYPIYPVGEAARGVLKLRTDNWAGAEAEEFEDEHGVKHRVERLASIGCTIVGVEESPTSFVPVSLSCQLPAPAELGGAGRPVVGELKAGASASEVVAVEVLQKAFFGDWHLIDGNLKRDGEGLFNTEHGQLAFGFEAGKLSRLTYYFDPPEKRWRAAQLWMQP